MNAYDQRASVSELPSADRSRWIALVALCAGFLMIILDQTIVNVALPSIQNDLTSHSPVSPGWSTRT